MKKKKYTPLKINCNVVVIESSICAGSAFVKPQTSSDVTTEWEKGNDQNKNYEWDW